jgi:exodeoxyribonuclease V beta subunit
VIHYRPIGDCRDIALDRHLLIEASAGTGKTYTIENLVVRLLVERDDIRLENILLVTFTEKATCELKLRIREKLEAELALSREPPLKARLREACDAFETAAIHTIHAFCQNLLQDFAFENRILFDLEVIDDGPLCQKLLNEQMRRAWPQWYADQLEEVLRLSGFDQHPQKVLDTIVQLVFEQLGHDGQLYLSPPLDGAGFSDLKAETATVTAKLKAVCSPPGAFAEDFGRLNINGRARNNVIKKIIGPLEQFLAECDPARMNIVGLIRLLDRIRSVTSQRRAGIDCLTPVWTQQGPNDGECPQLAAVIPLMERLSELCDQLSFMLIYRAAIQLKADLQLAKRQNGWISYTDMLLLVKEGLERPDARRLLELLREKYKVAFIDEFQDTDPLQWAIFRRIFLDTPVKAAPSSDFARPTNVLCLIGDPKQAIYAFRGADIFTYLDARRRMERLSEKSRARLYTLAENWRSDPDLIDVYNQLFPQPSWFAPAAESPPLQIGYRKARSPGRERLPMAIDRDDSKRPAFNVIDLSQTGAAAAAREALARFAAREIISLLHPGNVTIRDQWNRPRGLKHADIAILVRSGRDAVPFEEVFTAENIPHTFYRKPGLFASEEAGHLISVLRAVADLQNLSAVKYALLTPFFGVPLPVLQDRSYLPPGHSAMNLLSDWQALALHRKWPQLFHALLEQSGLVYRRAAGIHWQREITNYQQITSYLHREAHQRNWDLWQLIADLENRREHSLSAREDMDVHQIESDLSKVQIITMHSSKGLQFPVVFVAGGFHQGPDRALFHVYHQPLEHSSGPITRVVDLTRRTDPARFREEMHAEDKRLLYVALTRAQIKLYVPYYQPERRAGRPGAIQLILGPALMAAAPPTPPPSRLAWHDPQTTDDRIAKRETYFYEGADAKDPTAGEGSLFPPRVADHRYRKASMVSFSSMVAEPVASADSDPEQGGFKAFHARIKDRDEQPSLASPASIEILDDRSATLPAGAWVGSMLHEILEILDFERVSRLSEGQAEPAAAILRDGRTQRLIQNKMAAFGMDQAFLPEVCRLVTTTLTVPLPQIAEGFTLGQLASANRRHEVAFIYPLETAVKTPSAFSGLGFQIGDHVVRGIIDLVFQADGRYYLADWKSNRLADGYGRGALAAAMESHGYHLQYKIYTVALLRWLEQKLGRHFEAARHFGGVFYFFMRGMATGTSEGIFFASPESIGDRLTIETELAAYRPSSTHPKPTGPTAPVSGAA